MGEKGAAGEKGPEKKKGEGVMKLENAPNNYRGKVEDSINLDGRNIQCRRKTVDLTNRARCRSEPSRWQ